MRLMGRAGRFAGVSLVVGLLLAGCDKGPDRNRVAADLQKGVADYLVRLEGSQAKHILSHADVKVTPQQDAGYLVAINGVKIGDAADGYLDVGTVSYVVTPKDDKTYDASQLTLASDMPVKTPDGQPAGAVKLTTKAFNGTWLRAAENFTKLDLQFGDLVISDPQHGDNIKIAGAAFNIDGTDKGNGVWDQTGKLALTGFDIAKDEDGHLTIKEIDVTSGLQNLKLLDYTAKLRVLRDAMAKQAAAAQTATTPAAAPPSADAQTATAAPQNTDNSQNAGNQAGSNGSAATDGSTAANPAADATEAAVKDFANALPTLFSGFNSDFNVSGISYQATDPNASFDLGKAGITFSASGFDQQKVSLKFSIGHDALAIHAPMVQTELMQALLPANGALVISLNNVPSKDLASLCANLAPFLAHPDQANMEVQSAVIIAQLQQLLQQDGVSLKIEPSHLTSQATNVDATGDFSIQATAAHGAVGSLDVAITGLDQVIALAQKQSEQDPEAAQYAAMAQALLTYADRQQGGDGKAVDKFKIDVPQSGQLTVNGKPLQF
ncbi:MAG TPA: hypothetical protein VM659_08100 [Dongiaceae bacterium]|nr:hypothetical protein [Dongiaceae bacterium]